MMQTFLPYNDFLKTAQCLDNKRLGKQRVEAKQIIDTIEGISSGWKNHPIVKMWWNYPEALKLYFNIVSQEWINRGFKHTMGFYSVNEDIELPYWFGDEKFHSSHRAALLYKKYDWYSKFGWKENPILDYVWVV